MPTGHEHGVFFRDEANCTTSLVGKGIPGRTPPIQAATTQHPLPPGGVQIGVRSDQALERILHCERGRGSNGEGAPTPVRRGKANHGGHRWWGGKGNVAVLAYGVDDVGEVSASHVEVDLERVDVAESHLGGGEVCSAEAASNCAVEHSACVVEGVAAEGEFDGGGAYLLATGTLLRLTEVSTGAGRIVNCCG
eukprot:TRINITY_DN6392_c0_g2_i1.p2 TRINITY_DN6392_c0_g2~~TRINITY_DN6392_c0_g2_i1.p2  ORF type:complete len:193 (+),score=11.20 TRINITY_DN6392_c0_g2_i1:96-674(+)